MTALGDSATLKGDIIIDGVRYPLAKDVGDRKGIAWWRVGSDDEEEDGRLRIVTTKWRQGWQGGMGEMVRLDSNSSGYAYTENMDVSSYGFARLAEARFSGTPTAAPTDAPTYFFEQGGAIFCVTGRRGYRMTVSGTTITITHETDFGASATVGRPDKFLGSWWVPLGASVDYTELTTPATNSYTANSASLRALAFSVYQDGSTARFARAYSTNQVALTSTSPATNTWAAGFSVGDTSSAITNLVDTGVNLFVAKEDNMYVFDGTGNSFPVFNLARGSGDSTNGVGLVALPSTSIGLYNHQSGLHLLSAEIPFLNVGPDGLLSMQEVPGLTLEPFRGRHYESVVYGDWVYTLDRITNPTTRTYILAGRILRGLQAIIWHTYSFFEGASRGLFVDSSQRLWTIEGTNIVARQLGRDGSPNPGTTTNGRGQVSTTHRLVLSSTDFGAPMTVKQLQRVRVTTRGVDSTSPVQVQVIRDGGSIESVGETIASNGAASRWWSPGNNDTCQVATVVLTLTTTANYAPATSDPQIWGVEIDALLRPTAASLNKCVIDCGKVYTNKAEQLDPPREVRDRLTDLIRAASVRITDIDSRIFDYNILEVSDIFVTATPEGEHRYVVEVTLRQRPQISVGIIMESGVQVGVVSDPTTWEVAEGGVLVGSTISVTTVEVAENGTLVGSVEL